MKPPFTMYGSKFSLLPELRKINPGEEKYHEAFAGSLALLFDRAPVKAEFANDHNGNIYNFYKCIHRNFSALQRRIKEIIHSEELFYDSLKMVMSGEGTPFDRAAAFWYVTNVSRLNSGKSWKWCNASDGSHVGRNLSAKKGQFVDAIEKRLQYVQLSKDCGIKSLKKRNIKDIYHLIDPPYLGSDISHYARLMPKKGRKTWQENDLIDLLDILPNIEGSFTLCHFPHPLVEEAIINNGWNVVRVSQRGANQTNVKQELLICNYKTGYQTDIFTAQQRPNPRATARKERV